MKLEIFAITLMLGAGVWFDATATEKTSSDLERDARALELYLQDQADHTEFCPNLAWDQPPLSVYKETLKSHLPDDCERHE